MESLVILRILGGLLGTSVLLWAFIQFRHHIIKRHEFLLLTLFGLGVFSVAVYPNSINIIAEMLSLEDRQFGRLISLLTISSMLLWILVLGLRSKDTYRSIQFDLLVRSLAKERFFREEDRKKIRPVTVIIPALDEEENLDHVLARMPRAIGDMPLGVLVVDDGSTDATSSMARKYDYVAAINPINRGGGAALRLGFDIASEAGAQFIATMDADGQHLPEEIEQLVQPVISGNADIVIGSRVLGEREKDSLVRWLGIHVFNFVINLLAGTKVTDCSSGFRAFRVESLKQVLLLQDQFHTAELIIDAAKKGLRISEVPITIKRRMSGESKKGKNLTYGFNFLKTVLKTWFR